MNGVMGLKAILSKLSSTLPLLGFVFPLVWGSFFLHPLDVLSPTSFEVYYLAQGVTPLAIALVFSLRRYPRNRYARTLLWPFALAGCLAPYLALYPNDSFYDLSVFVSAAIGGASYVWFHAQWCNLYSRLDAKRMTFYALMPFILMPVIRAPLELLPLGIAIVIVTPFPILGVLMQKRAIAQLAREEDECPVAETEHSPGRNATSTSRTSNGMVVVVVVMAIFGFAMGLLRINIDTSLSGITVVMTGLLIKFVFPLAFYGLVRYAQRKISVSLICQLAMVSILISTLIATNVPHDVNILFIVFECIRQVMYILLFYTLCALAHRTEIHPLIVFGSGWAPYGLALSSGMFAASFIETPHASESFIMNVVCLTTIGVVLIFTLRDDANAKPFFQDKPEEGPLHDFEVIDRRCLLIADQYGLSKRELETMQFICKGRSKRYIAEHLMLSENTVRGYAKTLYTKLGVHSKQELLDLLGIS